MEIKVVNAGKCMICGKPIKLVIPRGYDNSKLPNIFFCRECEQELDEDIAKTADSQSDFDKGGKE